MKYFNVKEVCPTILTREQIYELPTPILFCEDLWWTCSPGVDPRFSGEDEDSYITAVGDSFAIRAGFDCFVRHICGVRPAFKIKDLDVELYERIKVGAIYCTVIDRNLALADYVVCSHQFDSKSNVWETSDLKKFIESDEFKKLLEGGLYYEKV